MLQNNAPESLPISKPKNKTILPLALALTFLAFGSLALAWYQTIYKLPSVSPAPIIKPDYKLIDINDYTSIDPVTGWTIYTNETVGYQISYPADWVVDRELGSEGYYYDRVIIDSNKSQDNQTKNNYIYIDPIDAGSTVVNFYNKAKSLDVGEVYPDDVYINDTLWLRDGVIRLATPSSQNEGVRMYLFTPQQVGPDDYFAETALFYPVKNDSMPLFRILSSVISPESPYTVAGSPNISTEEEYQESLQILSSFKTL